MGDLYRALGLGAQARASFQRALDIIERLAAAEPGRADYQRDLAVSHSRMGDLYSALGLGAQARASFQRSLDIFERLAAAEPGRVDYQRDLSCSYQRMGFLHVGEENKADALRFFQKDLGIAERLAAAEPLRADYQIDLVSSLMTVAQLRGREGVGELRRALAILHALKGENRLPPTHEPWIAKIEAMLGGVQ
jgi:tetratricopeptide (TPR) repeat protein